MGARPPAGGLRGAPSADRARLSDARDAALRHELSRGRRLWSAPARLAGPGESTRPSRPPWRGGPAARPASAARHPYSLSGGEQRRLALAGVLAMRPGPLLLDEPFVSLDPGARRELEAILRELRGGGLALVLATHDVDRPGPCATSASILAAGAWSPPAPGGSAPGGGGCSRAPPRPPFLVELWRRLGRATRRGAARARPPPPRRSRHEGGDRPVLSAATRRCTASIRAPRSWPSWLSRSACSRATRSPPSPCTAWSLPRAAGQRRAAWAGSGAD